MHTLLFRFTKFDFIPYSEDVGKLSSKSIFIDCIRELENLREKGLVLMIDKNKNRIQDGGPRELFMNRISRIPGKGRVLCRMCLIRSGKRPLIKKPDSFELVPISDLGDVVEYCNIIIDYSIPDRVIFMIEAHENGPRISDIEYYFRTIASEKLRKAKALKVEGYTKSSLREIINKLDKVTSIEIKFTPSSIKNVNELIGDNFLIGLITTSHLLDPINFTLKASYKKRLKANETLPKNPKGNRFVQKMIDFCLESSNNMDFIEVFNFDYIDINGEADSFNLLSDKVQLLCEVKDINTYKIREIHDSLEEKIIAILKELK